MSFVYRSEFKTSGQHGHAMTAAFFGIFKLSNEYPAL